MTRVPLILGIWGQKGMGKSFQTELAFKKLGYVSGFTVSTTLLGGGVGTINDLHYWWWLLARSMHCTTVTRLHWLCHHCTTTTTTHTQGGASHHERW